MATVGTIPGALAFWERLSPQVRASVVAQGVASPLLFRHWFDGTVEEARELVEELGGVGSDAECLCSIWAAVRVSAGAECRREATFTIPEAAAHVALTVRKRGRASSSPHTGFAFKALDVVPKRARSRAGESWPVVVRRTGEIEGDPNARSNREDKLRGKWLSALKDLVWPSGLPVVGFASELSDPSAVMGLLGNGRRAGAIRRRVLDRKRVARHLTRTFDRIWPQSPAQFLDYLSALSDGGSLKSVLQRAVFALAFMEASGGIMEASRLSKNPLITSALEEPVLRSAGDVTHATSKAPQLPVGFWIAFEQLVMSDVALGYVRMYAWFRLVKVWGSLRFDDHRGALPKLLEFSAAGLMGTLVRTKTSGAGRKREELYVHVSAGAFILVASWLEVGWRMWSRVSPDRDYFLVLPSFDLEGWILREARYTAGRSW